MRWTRLPVFIGIAGICLTQATCSSGNTGTARAVPQQHSGISAIRDIPYGADDRQRLDIYQPQTPLPDRPVAIFFYGGGFQNGDKKEYGFFGRALAEQGILTVIVNYRLFPQVSFPQFIYDGAAAASWVDRNAEKYGGNSGNIFLLGHASGGYLATLVALNGAYLQQSGSSTISITGVVSLAGALNPLAQSEHDYSTVFATVGPPSSLQLQTYLNPHEPRLLLLEGGNDDPEELRYERALAAAIRAKGGAVTLSEYPNLGRVGIMLPFSPIAHNHTDIVEDVVAFISGKEIQGRVL